MTEFTPWSALLGGGLIGLASGILLLLSGRVAGVSGIAGGMLRPEPGTVGWRPAFLLGLVIGVWVFGALGGNLDSIRVAAGWPALVIGGLLVGFGTQLGGGCTSGHGVSGISRFSARSIAATVLFMTSAGVTVYVARHVLGGGA
ncbi:YeeE/YedE family protein [Wenzhouxiangella sp. XN24]|uniref:YeeE/YedE family protein n=1 Tax=Wenzhouxiangella sp. XN24 TaxID=2713569 RepID=UPI0013EDE5C2|nr:YeeE/YedE family protein [Wenzhouxiangella sp. XN24]NGX14996.1 YeeE/YedE family protein [Wenzhouxiangella sp. XN24]